MVTCVRRCTNLCRCRTVWSSWRHAAHQWSRTTTVSQRTSAAAAANGRHRRRCRNWWRARRTCASGLAPRRRRPSNWRSSNRRTTTGNARPPDQRARLWVCRGGRTPTGGRRPGRGKRVRRTLRAWRPARAAAAPAGRRRRRFPCPGPRPPSTRGAATVGWTGLATRAKTTTPWIPGPPLRSRSGPRVWDVRSPPCPAMCRARARRRLYYIIIIIRTATTTARCSVVPRTRPLRAQTQTAAAAGCAGPAARGSPRRADARTQPPPLPLVPRAVRGYTAFYRRLVSRIGIVLLRYIYIYLYLRYASIQRVTTTAPLLLRLLLLLLLPADPPVRYICCCVRLSFQWVTVDEPIRTGFLYIQSVSPSTTTPVTSLRYCSVPINLFEFWFSKLSYDKFTRRPYHGILNHLDFAYRLRTWYKFFVFKWESSAFFSCRSQRIRWLFEHLNNVHVYLYINRNSWDWFLTDLTWCAH